MAQIATAPDLFLKRLEEMDNEKTILITNSSIWYNLNYNLKGKLLPFLDKKKKDLSRKSIKKEVNDWVNEKTKGLIPEIDAGLPSLNYNSLLINTLYLKCFWQNVFNSPFFSSRFKLLNGKYLDVSMLSKSFEEEIGYLKEKTFEAIAIPYEEKKIQFEIYLPSEEIGFKKFINQLDEINFNQTINQFKSETNYIISFPKFEMSNTINIGEALKNKYVSKLFNIRNSSFFKEDVLNINQLYQSSRIKVNEEGTEAAAVTFMPGVGGAGTPKYNVTFIANRPFFYLVRETVTNTILFTGLLTKPPTFIEEVPEEIKGRNNWLSRLFSIFRR